jgi:four helix bundle protein
LQIQKKTGTGTIMTPEEMKARTLEYGLRVIRVVRSLPREMVSQEIGRQLLRAGTSVGANYRAACRSRSDKDFLARLGVVEEEADESLYWMELLVQSGLVKREQLSPLMKEGNEILSIVVASLITVKRRTRGKGPPGPVEEHKRGAIPCASSPQVALSSPQSEIRNPDSETTIPPSSIPNAGPGIRNPKSQIPNPKSQIPNPKSPMGGP